ncbi:hypothetical protein MG7_03940 [Candida albicans P34048]|nr:hypothetical protein MG7_03940 [Candida albicans P34048]
MNDTWRSRLKEISHITADPFLRDFHKLHTNDKEQIYSILHNPDNVVEQTFKNTIIKSMEESMFRPLIPTQQMKRRQNDHHNQGPPPKVQKSTVDSLKSQHQIDQQNFDWLLSQPLEDLEVMTVPEQYPLTVPAVLPLAELYYLTQTLASIKLLPGSHKVLMTENFESALAEGKIAVLYSRIEELKRQGKWSLRQPQKFYDPFKFIRKSKKKSFHWDYLLQEGKWMADDFRESSKYKKWCCVVIAEAVEQYWKGRKVSHQTFVDVADLKKIDKSIIRNLPVYTGLGGDSREPPIATVSKLVYPAEDNHWYKIALKPHHHHHRHQTTHQGLFGSTRKYNTLKPPKPPTPKNIEYRIPTIWLPEDDKRLIHYVAEFCFNWDLISEHISSSSSAVSLKKYESNIERRTPWQCFERYIQLNDKFQFSDMKGVYAYHAQQWLEQAHRAQSTTKRRISPLGVGPESVQRGNRKLRWASMFDAMRKAMKKREIAAAKINHRKSTAELQANQNVTEPKPNSDRIPTPAELSRLKFERDKTLHENHINQQATRARMVQAVAKPAPAPAPPPPQPPKPVKRPTTPNGTPLTNEQIQHLLQMQKHRRMLQQQQQQQQQQQHQQQQRRRIHFPPAQVSKVINDIQQQNPGLSKDQVTKLAAQYLASLSQQGYGVPSSPVPPHQKNQTASPMSGSPNNA